MVSILKNKLISNFEEVIFLNKLDPALLLSAHISLEEYPLYSRLSQIEFIIKDKDINSILLQNALNHLVKIKKYCVEKYTNTYFDSNIFIAVSIPDLDDHPIQPCFCISTNKKNELNETKIETKVNLSDIRFFSHESYKGFKAYNLIWEEDSRLIFM